MIDNVLIIINILLSIVITIWWGKIIYDSRIQKIGYKHVLCIVTYIILFLISIKYFSTLLNIGTLILGNLILHQTFFHKSFSQISAGIIIVSIIKIIFVAIESLIVAIIPQNYSLSICYHIIITTIGTTLLILLLRNRINKIIKKFDIQNNASWLSVITVNCVIITIFILEISQTEIKNNFIFVIPIVLLLYLLFTFCKFVYQKVTLNATLAKYHEIYEFAKFMENLINNYKTEIYDTRDELIELKSKLKTKDTKIISDINTMIERKSHINYSWIITFNDLNILGLKGFFAYKINEIKNLDIEVDLFISDTLNNIETNINDKDLKTLYTVIGIFCDNAIEAAINSNEKTITFQAYYENNEIHLLIANTYYKTPSKNFEEFGVTNKKRGCGTGLYIAQSLIQNSNILSKKTTIMDDFFVQELIIITNK